MTPFSVASTRIAQAHDRDAVVELLAAAYADSAVVQWIQPDPTIRATAIPRYARAVVDYGLAYGVVLLSADRKATAIWYLHDPSDGMDTRIGVPGDDGAAADELDLIAVLGAGAAARLELFTDVLAGLRPTMALHELTQLGMHPDHQRQGLASRLLADHHDHLDTAGIPAYTVATSPAVRDFYGHHEPATPPDAG